MKIKIIDLLNKIANNEEVPKKIKWLEQIYEYSDNDKFYYQNGYSMYRDFYTEGNCLNEDVEIIEEPKKIEKIEIYEDSDGHYFYDKHCKKIYITCDEINFMLEQFNELIDEINNLKEK